MSLSRLPTTMKRGVRLSDSAASATDAGIGHVSSCPSETWHSRARASRASVCASPATSRSAVETAAWRYGGALQRSCVM